MVECSEEASALRVVPLREKLCGTVPSCPDGIPSKLLHVLAEKLNLLHNYNLDLIDIELCENRRGWIVRFNYLSSAVFDYRSVRLGLSSSEHSEALYRIPELTSNKTIHKYCCITANAYALAVWLGRFLALARDCRLEPERFMRMMRELYLAEDPNGQIAVSVCIAMRNLVDYFKLLQEDPDASPATGEASLTTKRYSR